MKQKNAELIQQVLQGDQDAFGLLVKKYQKGVHALAWRKIGDFHIAEEITQDAFLKAYHKLDTLKNHNLFAGWLYVIATRLCSDWLEKKSRSIEVLETVDVSTVEQGTYSQYMAEKQGTEADETRREIVKRLLQKLPESERTVITLYYFGEMTCEAIGEFLGVSENTIKSRLSRARNRLKKEEDLLRQNLGSFQLPAYLRENIMQEISRIKPAVPSANKPVVPWGAAAAAVVVFLLIGVGTQYLSRFQKPYNLNAASEPTVELIEALFVLDSPAKPATRNQAGNSVILGKTPGVGQKLDAPLFAAVAADETDIATPKPQWIQTKGPEGGRVVSLFATTRRDIYAGTAAGLYRLTDGEHRWQLITSDAPEAFTVYTQIGWWSMTEHRNTLYFATNTEVLASPDRGETWNTLGTHPKNLPIGIVITDGELRPETDIVIYLALADGIFRSEDGGQSWTPLKDGLGNRKIRALAAVENTIFAGTDDGLYRLDSDTGTWERLVVTHADMRGQKQPIRALAAARHRLYVAVGKQFTNQVGPEVKATMAGNAWWALYRSTDLGDTWYAVDLRKKLETKKKFKDRSVIEFSVVTDIENEHSASVGRYVKIFASEGKVIVTDLQERFYSLDTGETWTSLDLNDATRQQEPPPVVMLDANTFYIGGKTGIHRTTDGGQSWHPFNTGIVSTDVTNLIAANGRLYAQAADGIVSSTDGGTSWTLLSIGPGDITALAKFNATAYAREEKKMVSRFYRFSTEDDRFMFIPGIPTFEKVTPDEQAWLNKRNVPFREALTEETKQNFKVDKPLDLADYDLDKLSAALTKQFHEINPTLSLARSGNFAISDTAYYVERRQKLFRWKPGTAKWHDTGFVNEGKRTPTGRSNADTDTSGFWIPSGLTLAASGHTVYVGTRNGDLFQSFDEADTWNKVTANLPFPVEHFKIIAFAGSTVYIATDKGVTYSSDGTHWHKTVDEESKPIVINRFAIAGTTVYGTTDIHVHPERHVYQLKADSNTWKQVTPEIRSRVTSLAVDGKMLYVGTIGRGVLRFTLDEYGTAQAR